MKVIMISYNSFVYDEESLEGIRIQPNGWKHSGNNSVLHLQNVNETESAGFRVRLMTDHWSQAAGELSNVDKVILYLGMKCAEPAMELAAKHVRHMPDRVIFVSCSCDWSLKTELVNSYGFASSKLIQSYACGGYLTMNDLYRDALNNGVVPD